MNTFNTNIAYAEPNLWAFALVYKRFYLYQNTKDNYYEKEYKC